MGLKYSAFNIIDTIDGCHYSFYNIKSAKHLVLRLEHEYGAAKLFDSSTGIDMLPVNLRDKLIQEGFIVANNKNEYLDLQEWCYLDRTQRYNGLYLTILPTLSCNFTCVYCYEDLSATNTSSLMNDTTQANIVKFIEHKLATGIAGKVQIKWFGGEPLLAKNIIINLTKNIRQALEKYNNEYSAVLVTNGYLLDQLSVAEIKELCLQTIQVTLDGPEAIHNMRRPVKNGTNAFQRIINNLEQLLPYFPNVIIRINVDQANAPYVHELFLFLRDRGLLDLCEHIQFAYVDMQLGKFSKGSQCNSYANSTLVQKAYEQISINLKLHGLDNLENLRYPQLLSVACDAHIANYYAVDPEGFVFKCTGDASMRDRAIFNLNTQQDLNRAREIKFLQANLALQPQCQSCALLPICQGGCAAKYFDLHTTGPFCWSFCHVVRQTLIKLAKRAIT